MLGIPSTDRPGHGSKSKGVGDMSNFRSFSSGDDFDDVEATGALVPATPAKEDQGDARDLSLLGGRDRFCRGTVAAAAARFYFDENDQLPV